MEVENKIKVSQKFLMIRCEKNGNIKKVNLMLREINK